MAWAEPSYSKSQVDAAGRVLCAGLGKSNFDDYLDALNVLSNWRSSHSFPLNTFQNGLRKRGHRIDDNALVAQRIKRLPSIELKLRRFSGLRLSQLQDIGGARIVFAEASEVNKLVQDYRKSDLRHELAKMDDYIQKPQISGYHGVHLIYKYRSDRNSIYNGLRIELQIRSQLQHAWATAVETVGTFLRQSLKSSMGEDRWLRFFALMGTAIARTEGTPSVPETPTDMADLAPELRAVVDELDVLNRLEVFGSALSFIGDAHTKDSQYYLLRLDPVARRIEVDAYSKGELERAQQAYLTFERELEGSQTDAVLVSVDSVSALQKAYPNYFLDTRAFMNLVRDTMNERPLRFKEAAETAVEDGLDEVET